MLLIFREKSLKPLKLFPIRSEADRGLQPAGDQAEAPKEAKKEEGGGFFGFGKKEAPVQSLALYTTVV